MLGHFLSRETPKYQFGQNGNDRQGRYGHKKHWLIRRLSDLIAMEDVPDQDSANNSKKTKTQLNLAYPSNPGGHFAFCTL